MNSREKITLLIDELPELLPTGGMDMAVLRLAAVELGPKLASMLPQDPERLDQLLLDFAAQVLAMRSDTASPNAAE